MILSIDPGPKDSAALLWNGAGIIYAKILPNEKVLAEMRDWTTIGRADCYIETIQNYGTLMGASTINTCIWIGRFVERWLSVTGHAATLVTRPTVKLHLCGTVKANDSHVREALIERIGPPGTKRQPGPTYGIATHLWAALALAVYAHDTQRIAMKERVG